MKRFPIFLGLLVVAGAAVPVRPQGVPPPLRVSFLSLEHGDATLIQAPGGLNGLLGVGAAGDAGAVAAHLRRRGISRLDVVVAATWSERSLGGLPALLAAGKVGRVVRNQLYVPTATGERVLAEVDKRGVRSFSPPPGGTETLFRSPPCQMRAVAPTGPMLARFAKDPRCSAMYEFQYDRISVLCLGDASREHQQAMWEQVDPRPWGHVLQIGRNGAAGALLPSMLKELKTRYVVLPIPRKSGAAPAPETLTALRRAGVKVYRTDRNGTVTVTTDGTHVNVRAEH
jgi:competence protein ComEC